MKLRNWIAVGVTATFGSLSATSLAQDTPAAPSEEEQDAAPRFKLNELTLGATTFDGEFSINQYASPFMGFGLQSLRLLTPGSESRPFSKFVYRGMPNQDNFASVVFHLSSGRTVVRAERGDFSHYTLAWQPKPESNDKAISVILDHAIAPGVGGFVAYRSEKREGNYPAPRDPDLTQSQVVSGGVGGNVLGGNGNVSVTERRTYTDTGNQPTTMNRSINATFNRDLSDRLNLGGAANFTRIEQNGQQGSDVTTLALNGSWEIGPMTSLQFSFSDQDIDNNVVQNAYVRKRLSSGARLLHRLPGWNLQLGFRHMETERLRADQSYVDVPESNAIDFRAAGKLGAAKLTVKGSWEDVDATAVMQTDEDDRQLYWNKKSMLQARIEGGGDNFVAYGALTYKNRQNEGRGVEVKWANVAIGGSYTIDPTLSTFAEASIEGFEATGGAETNQVLDSYFPHAKNFAAGVDWARDPATWASASVNFFESGDVRGAQLTFNLRRTLSPDSELDIYVAPWSRDDRQFDLTGYHTTFLSARYTVRF